MVLKGLIVSGLLFAVLLAGCQAGQGQTHINTDKLDAAVDAQIGGDTTCLVLTDVKSGSVIYQYGSTPVCMTALPPCETFEAPAAAAALDAGTITPATVYPWDGSPQPFGAWQASANLAKAVQTGAPWWWRRLTRSIGHDAMAQALRRFGYGNEVVGSDGQTYWMGPKAGGALSLTTRQQAGFLRRLYAGQLGLKPQTGAALAPVFVDELRNDSQLGQATISGVEGGCATAADGSDSVSWWAGRLQTKTHDLAFAASVVGQAPPPAIEIKQKVKDAFAQAGLWPAG